MKPKIKTKLVIFIVLAWSVSLIFALVSAKSNTEIKAGQILIAEPSHNGSFFISANISSNESISPILKADFPFNALYLQWQSANSLKLDQDFDIYVKFLNENWSQWLEIAFDDDNQGKDSSDPIFSSQMVPTKLTDSFQYKLVFKNPAAKENIKNLQFIYLDTTKGSNSRYKIAGQTDGLNIISRQQWGANENYRYDSSGADLWPEEYYMPKKFVIHHTAGENANADPTASIRAIQYYHAVQRGWGDIGYNYLIDSSGNIYEGRAGGDGAVGGHAYLRNRNTIGIAILGCYDQQTSGQKAACNTATQLTEATQTALNKLIAVKSREFNIDPNGVSEFHGQILPNVLGHRDVGSTTCPGNLLYDQLPQTRQLAYNLLPDLGGYKKPLPASAEFVSQSTKDVTIEETKSAEVTIEFKNTGQETWRGYEDNYVFIAGSDIKNKMSRIDSIKMALANEKSEAPENNSQTSQQIFKLLGGNVYPGQTGKFKIILTPAADKQTETKNFTLAWLDKGYFNNADFSITINKIACANCGQTTSQITETYQASLNQSDFPKQMAANALIPVTMKFQNIGNTNWEKNNLKLKIIYNSSDPSPFKNDSWYDEWASIIPQEDIIAPNSLATFSFKLKAPGVIASFPHTISLQYGNFQQNNSTIQQFNNLSIYQSSQVIEVISPFGAEIIKNTIPDSAKKNSRPKVTMTFKNIGTATWTNPTLKSYDIDYTNSWFKDWSWLDKKTIKKIKKTVKPGEEIEFTFRIQAYWKPNTYPHLYKLFDGKNEIYLGGQKEFKMVTQVTK